MIKIWRGLAISCPVAEFNVDPAVALSPEARFAPRVMDPWGPVLDLDDQGLCTDTSCVGRGAVYLDLVQLGERYALRPVSSARSDELV